MQRRLFGQLALLAMAQLLPAGAIGGEPGTLTVRVTDNAGAPVEHVVVGLRPTEKTDPLPAPATVVIDQRNRQFHPWVSAQRPGGKVVFSNHDDITHHVYSFSPAKRFSFRLQSGEHHPPLVFDTPGVVALGCNIHDWMVGYIYVTDAAYMAGTDAAGQARFTNLPAARWQLTLWHPGLDNAAGDYARDVATPAQGEIVIRLREPLHETGPREPFAPGYEN